MDRYSNTAKLLTIVILAYVIQMSPTFVTCVWDVIEKVQGKYGSPEPAKMVVVVISSMGGVLNGIAYTAIRKKESSEQPKQPMRPVRQQNNQN